MPVPAGSDDRRGAARCGSNGRPARRRRCADGRAAWSPGFPRPRASWSSTPPTLAEWGWPEQALPGYIAAATSTARASTPRRGEYRPAAHLPPADADPHPQRQRKWLNEISHRNPLWIHPETRARLGVETGDLVRVTTEIGYFVNRPGSPRASAPGVVACSHHLGRWRLQRERQGSRWSTSALVDARRPARRHLAACARSGRRAVRQRRPRLAAHLVERRRRAPEPDLPGAPRPGQRACTAGTRR